MFWNLSDENDFFCSKTPKFSDNKYRRTLRETKSNQVWSVSFKASSWVNTAATFWHKNKFKFPHFFPTFKINCLYFLNGKVWFFWHECNILSLFFDFRGATMQFLTKYWPSLGSYRLRAWAKRIMKFIFWILKFSFPFLKIHFPNSKLFSWCKKGQWTNSNKNKKLV